MRMSFEDGEMEQQRDEWAKGADGCHQRRMTES